MSWIMNQTALSIAVVVDTFGSGYSKAPGMTIRDGTLFDPINPGGSGVSTSSPTLSIDKVVVDASGGGYGSPPIVTISDPNPNAVLATATAVLDNGVISTITLKKGGSGYLTSGGIRKFVDTLPGLSPSGANNLDSTSGGGARHHNLPRGGLLRDRRGPIPGKRCTVTCRRPRCAAMCN